LTQRIFDANSIVNFCFVDMTREDFFEIVEKVFHEVLKEILAGKGLPLPHSFFCHFYGGEEMECSSELYFPRSDVLTS